MIAKRRTKPRSYPGTYGRFVADSDVHYFAMTELRDRLTARYSHDPNVYVSGSLLVDYDPENPRNSLSPDVFVVFGVPNHPREVYKTWKEGKYPDVIFEITSKISQNDDIEEKCSIYQKVWKVKEYFLFDPREEYLDPSLLGYRLHRGELKPIRAVRGVLTSKLLGITIEHDGQYLLMRDVVTGEEVLTDSEREARAERLARQSAEAELARVKAELDALRKQSSKK